MGLSEQRQQGTQVAVADLDFDRLSLGLWVDVKLRRRQLTASGCRLCGCRRCHARTRRGSDLRDVQLLR